MQTTSNILKSISEFSSDEDQLPPVEQWDPDFCGEMDMLIKANGDWLHQGSPISRKKLVTLFSRILIREESQYFLITPVEKIAIKVEWQPFVIIDFDILQESGVEYFLMRDNCNNQVRLSDLQQLQFSEYQGQLLPIINIRRNLFASFSRSCYYRLIEQAKLVNTNGEETMTITSAGINFTLGKIN